MRYHFYIPTYKEKVGMFKKKLNKKNSRSNSFRLTHEETAELKEVAAMLGYSRNSLLRRLVLQFLAQQRQKASPNTG